MTRLASTTSIRAILFAAASIGAATLATAPAAEARHFRDLGLSISIGDGYSSVHIGRSCRYYYRKWTSTGDAYWWDRYEACRDGY